MAGEKVSNENRMNIVFMLAKGNAQKAVALDKLSNNELQELLSCPEKLDTTVQATSKTFFGFLGSTQKTSLVSSNIFIGNIGNSNFESMDGLQIERCSFGTEVQNAPVVQNKKEAVNVNHKITDEELLQKWDSLPEYVKNLYQTYLDNLSEAERIEAEKGFLDKIRDFFSTGFKLSAYTDNPAAMMADGASWQKGVEDALTNDVQKKLKKDEKNIKQLANLSVNFEQNIDTIKSTLKGILGVDVSDEEIRANKDKLLQIAELSKDFDTNLSEITKIFKEMTGLDVLEEDLLKNKDNIDKLNKQSEVLEKQYENLKAKYKEITGQDLSDEAFEKLLNGESEVDNDEFNQLLTEYVKGYEEFAETASDVVSGVASFGAFCAGTMAGGPVAGYAAAVATGAGVKYGLKKANASNKSEGYNTAAQDLITGGVGGLFNALAPTVGSAASRAVFNRGGKVLLEKIAMKSANKALPAFLNKAVSMDNKFLGASTAQKLASRYMQAAVEGTTSVTPYNIAAELTDDEEHKQGWANVATNSVLGGIILGPVMDLGFRAVGKGTSKLFSENMPNIVSPIQGLQSGSPASAAAYKNITPVSGNVFDVNISGKNVRVKIPSSQLPSDPAFIYAAACKQEGINSKEEMFKTLGLEEIHLPNDKKELNDFVLGSKDNDRMILSASDGQQNYTVKVNDDNTVTVSKVQGDGSNYSVETKTMSVEDFNRDYKVSGYLRDVLPEYITAKSLDRMTDKKNILLNRKVINNSSEEVVLESINKENKTVVVKLVTQDARGTVKTVSQVLSYDDFIGKYQKQRNVNDVLALISDVAQKYGYDERSLRNDCFKGLDVDHPVFKNEQTMLAYIKDFSATVQIRTSNGEPAFNFKTYNGLSGQVEGYFDVNFVKDITAFKYANPEFEKPINQLLSAVKNGSISPKELRNTMKAFENGYVSASTFDLAANKGLIKDGKVNFTGLIDDALPTGGYLAKRTNCVSNIENILGKQRFAELKNLMGEDLYKVPWESTNGMKPNEIIKFVEDMKNIYVLKCSEIDPESFFVNIQGYGKNANWAKSMVQTSDYASMMMKEGATASEVFDAISRDTRQMDLSIPTADIGRKESSGVPRYKIPYYAENGAMTPYGIGGKYDVYKDRFDDLLMGKTKELTNPYPDMDLTRIGMYGKDSIMLHPKGKYAQAALKHVEDIYSELQKTFAGKKITEADLPFINEKIAEIHWILAHSMPWGRGSDAIANSFVKSVYKSLDIKTYPLEKDVSLDLQAFCTELSDYKKNYAKYYSKPPEVGGH